jgi:hypothetical protein
MSFALLIIGITLIVAAVRGTHKTLIALLKADFSGPGNFVYWLIALIIIGAVGYVEKLRPLSDGLLVLVLLVLVLARANPGAPRGGFFQQFLQAVQATNTPNVGAAGSGVGVQLGGTGINIGGSNTPGLGRGGINIQVPPIVIG